MWNVNSILILVHPNQHDTSQEDQEVQIYIKTTDIHLEKIYLYSGQANIYAMNFMCCIKKLQNQNQLLYSMMGGCLCETYTLLWTWAMIAKLMETSQHRLLICCFCLVVGLHLPPSLIHQTCWVCYHQNRFWYYELCSAISVTRHIPYLNTVAKRQEK